jgi:glycosyltransferase involved in cell wall biosynthesis
MTQLRVLRVIARLNIGGPAIQAITLTRRLDPSRFSSVLATGRCAPGEQEMSALLAREEVEPHRISGLGRALHAADDARAFAGLVSLLRRLQPHILHTHTAKAGALGRIAGALLRVPVRVHTFHGHVFRGYFSPAKTQAAIMTERGLARLSHRIIAISEAQRRDLCEVYHIAPPEKVSVVPLGFDLSPFLAVSGQNTPGPPSGRLRAELGLSPGALLVGIVGRVAPIKNHRLFLDALALTQQRLPQVHGVIIGDGTEAEIRALRAQAERLGITSGLHLLGYRTDLAPLYADLDAVALTSDNEGTPVALIEALAAGRACIATSVGGVPDVLREGELGVLVAPQNAETFAAELVNLLRDPARRAALGARGPASVEARYGLSRLCGDLESLYLSLWNAPRP